MGSGAGEVESCPVDSWRDGLKEESEEVEAVLMAFEAAQTAMVRVLFCATAGWTKAAAKTLAISVRRRGVSPTRAKEKGFFMDSPDV